MTEAAACPFAGREDRDEVRITMRDGTTMQGSYYPLVRMHFLVVPDASSPIGSTSLGPIKPAEVASVELLKTRAEYMEERRAVWMGEPVPGRQPVTRDDYENRLRTLARVMAEKKDADWQRFSEVERQFRDCADRIELAQGKREWLIREAAWYRSHNAPPDMGDLWQDHTAHPSMFARPRPQDFHPDPAERNRRSPPPAHVLADPRSIRNMLAALQEAGLNVYVTRLGDPPWDRGALLVRLPIQGRAQFVLAAFRDEAGVMQWVESWDGNISKPGMARRRRADQMECVRIMREIMRTGRTIRQGVLL